MITQQLYEVYLDHLLSGDRSACAGIVQELLDQNTDIKELYLQLFQRSLYQVGELWERDRISVAREHLATAITEGLMSLFYPRLFTAGRSDKRAVISCAANEYHQVGGKMVADIFEMNGWEGYFLGANTPVDQLVRFVDDTQPELVGLSLSVQANFPALKAGMDAIRAEFPKVDIVFGGQAFQQNGGQTIGDLPGASYIASLSELESEIVGA
jgi:methanogenic corrinoid protein MtbC1